MVTGVKPTTTQPFNDMERYCVSRRGSPIQLATSINTTLKSGEQIVIA